MSFLRHKQIYRPMLLTSKRDSFATVPLSSSDESATGYSLRVALLQRSLALHRLLPS